MEDFGVSLRLATLGLTLFVAGYGISPMILSPLQEMPSLGRLNVYMATLFAFFIVNVITAVINNVGGIMVLRVIAGFMGGPALATGGATISDMYGQAVLPYVMFIWGIGAVCGPVLGPVIVCRPFSSRHSKHAS